VHLSQHLLTSKSIHFNCNQTYLIYHTISIEYAEQQTRDENALKQKDTYADVSDSLSNSVVPEPVVEPQSHQFQWWLRAVCVFCWHVEVIHERQHLLPAKRNVDAFRALLNAAFDDVLNVV